MIHYLESINRPINYTGGGGIVEGVIFKNITTSEEVTATHISIQTFPSELIGFEVPWTVTPVDGNKVLMDYDEVTGAYEDPNALDEFDQPIPIKSQTVVLINCKDPT